MCICVYGLRRSGRGHCLCCLACAAVAIWIRDPELFERLVKFDNVSSQHIALEDEVAAAAAACLTCGDHPYGEPDHPFVRHWRRMVVKDMSAFDNEAWIAPLVWDGGSWLRVLAGQN
ncbi:2807_t:CDS:2 [Acaulospora colombiana]|uniref:2807_t:CDS:1 n=1 Tax=Acaulospora colombiana TaxID=27376 RepID=A0ACA9N0D0_9GLOM|nr:2807_t:CDS:2 [Acaulospora colombiana]